MKSDGGQKDLAWALVDLACATYCIIVVGNSDMGNDLNEGVMDGGQQDLAWIWLWLASAAYCIIVLGNIDRETEGPSVRAV